VEFWLRGTHAGPLRGLPPTGKSFECRMTAFFLFDGDRLVNERVYFDADTILRQLGVSHDMDSVAGRVTTVLAHPLTIGRAITRSLLRR
jgi:SnoaL-like polyketide cyclase